MTNQEKKVLDASVELWNEFCELPKEHPDDENEFRFHVHAIQNMIFARQTIREYRAEGEPSARQFPNINTSQDV